MTATGTLGASSLGGVVEHDLEVGPPTLTSTLDTAVSLEVEVEVHNRGRRLWSFDDGYAVAYHWFDEEGNRAIWDGRRSPLEEPVLPGESRVVTAFLDTPDRAGSYFLQWDVVKEGELWISDVDPTPVARQLVTVVATHGFAMVRAETPRLFTASGARSAVVLLRNDGSRTWPADGSVSLAFHWFDSDGAVVEWEGRRVAVGVMVAPGETIELRAKVTAPGAPGRYRLQWDMVEDGVCWFSQRDARPKPPFTVLVAPSVINFAWLWTAVVAVAAVVVLRRERRRSMDGIAAMADVGWLVGAVMLKQVWVLYAAGTDFSTSGWCFTLASALMIGCLLVLLPRGLRPWVTWTVGVLITAVLFVDLIHERFFGDLVSMAALRSAGQVAQVGGSVRSLVHGGDLWFWTDLPAALVLVFAVGRYRVQRLMRLRLALGTAAAVVLLSIVGFVALDRSIRLRQVFHMTYLARHVGVLNLHVADAGRGLVRATMGSDLSGSEHREVVEFFEHRRSLRAGSGPLFGAAEGRNLVMIQVESLQAFVVGLKVGGEEVTPFLNELAGRSFAFDSVTDQTEEGRSSDSELATQVSLLPPNRGAAAFLFADNHYTALASVLGAHGYATLSAVPFDSSFWNRRTTHRSYGFERSLFVDDFDPGESLGWGLNDRDFLTQAADRLVDLPRPWCAYLLTLSLHHPFDGFPDHLKLLDLGGWEGTPLGNFLHTMHYFDRALEDFISALDETGLLEETVVALWGDHDAGFEWRPEIAEVAGVAPDAAGWYLSQRVPLVISVPGVEGPADALTVPAGHTDVAPTLLALLGIDPAPYAFLGRNLLGLPGSGPVVGEYRCWNDATHVYLRRGPRLGDGQCFERGGMGEVAVEACATGFEAARRQVEISELVLEHDLQRALRSPPER